MPSNTDTGAPVRYVSEKNASSNDIEDNLEESIAGSKNSSKPSALASFFVLKGSSNGKWLYTCRSCYGNTISASFKSRSNLQNHVE